MAVVIILRYGSAFSSTVAVWIGLDVCGAVSAVVGPLAVERALVGGEDLLTHFADVLCAHG